MPSGAGAGSRHGSGQVGGPRLGVPRSELAELWGFAASGGRSSFVFLLLPKSLNRLFSVIPSGKSIISGSR